jgi:hypothetical protein
LTNVADVMANDGAVTVSVADALAAGDPLEEQLSV